MKKHEHEAPKDVLRVGAVDSLNSIHPVWCDANREKVDDNDKEKS